MSDVQFQMTKPAPIVWANVVSPRAGGGKLNSKPRFEVTFLFAEDHPDFAGIKQQMAAEGKAKLGRTDFKYPLKRGDKVADEAAAKDPPRDREFLRGYSMFLPHSPVTKLDGTPLAPPRLVVLTKAGKYVRFADEERALAKQYFYSGVLAVGTFAFMAYEGMGGGVTAYLREILALEGSGTKINTGVDDETKYGSADNFKGYVGHVSTVDPTAGLAAEVVNY